jgi:hypothetical protein
MRKRVLATFCASILALPQAAHAGAWIPDRGHWQIFSSATTTQSVEAFDGKSRLTQPIRFDKLLLQNTMEYGLTRHFALFLTPEYVVARSEAPGAAPVMARDTAIEGGMRIRLTSNIGVLSVQASLKSAGAFDMSDSAGKASARQGEFRILYGTNFKLFGDDGFADIEAGERWINRPRPNETPFDATAGLWLSPNTMLMAQSFNVVSSGDAHAPFTYYRAHKLEFSVVRKVSPHWFVQLGGIFSPAGQNALAEHGVSLALWTHI